MSLKKNLSFLLIFIPFVLSENKFKIIKNDMRENMKDLAIGIAMVAIEENLDFNGIATKLTNGFNSEYGSDWICFVGSTNLSSHFEASPNTTIWFTIGSVQIVLFKPMDRVKSKYQYIIDARKQDSVLSIVKNEMNETMKEHIIGVSLIAIKTFNDFESISKNISASLERSYSYHWVCSISPKSGEIYAKYFPNTMLSFTIADLQIILFQTNIPLFKVSVDLSSQYGCQGFEIRKEQIKKQREKLKFLKYVHILLYVFEILMYLLIGFT